MRRRYQHGQYLPFPIDGDSRYAGALAAHWLDRLLEQGLIISEPCIELAQWMSPRASLEIRQALRPLRMSKLSAKRKSLLKDVLTCHDSNLADELDTLLFEKVPDIENTVRGVLRKLCAAVEGRPSPQFRKAREHLQVLFGLSETACEVCEFLYCIAAFTPVEEFFEDHLALSTPGNMKQLSRMLGYPLKEVYSSIKTMEDLGLVDTEHRITLEESGKELWRTPSRKDLEKKFLATLEREHFALSTFSLQPEQLAHMRALLTQSGKAPVHILLYGPPGTGKSTFAYNLAKELGRKVWSVGIPDDGEQASRRTNLKACSSMMAHVQKEGQGALMVVDEADDLLEVRGKPRHRAWLNAWLEEPQRCSIWIANDVSGVDEAVARRFGYSVYFPAQGWQERKCQWERILNDAKMLQKLAPGVLEELVRDFDIPMGVMAHAVAQGKLLGGRSAPKFLVAVRQHCTSFVTLCHEGKMPKDKGVAARSYDLRACCMDSTALSADSLLQRMRAADEVLRQDQSLHAGTGTMLFYGPPGTGKTALARYLAQELKRPCHVVQPSSWLGSYVGETEGRMVESFQKATAEGAVLVIDEADTFIFSREDANRSWESSMVNEFLTNLEDFTGFCICTTNRMGQLDKAALRRFSFKVPFTWLSEDAAARLYESMLAPLASAAAMGQARTGLSSADLCPSALAQLSCLCRKRPGLTPGDFRAVRAAFNFSMPEQRSHKALLLALQKELEAKQTGRGIGFGG